MVSWLLLNSTSGVWAKGVEDSITDAQNAACTAAMDISARRRKFAVLSASVYPLNTSGLYCLQVTDNSESGFCKSYKVLIVESMQNTTHRTPQ